MSEHEDDPHIHVVKNVTQAGAAYRTVITSMFGRAIDSPSIVTTGCGLRVRYVMTATHPDKVTCLACREHAQHEHLRLADRIERLSRGPGSPVASDRGSAAAQHLRDLARRFAPPG
ncbi:hypothetical protein [Nocardia aurantia]|uniref:Uncharacterized protein n=1 Tax=Nocardia aurantia TaxID=2585199 RepID=A0A7K0DLL0_9NOCA|nr:hypothetical protein [Nocardia aurantia]MQY26660.1 hypothetical protein [Nocardia aurantia]